jgi:hypothetical protein
MELLEKCGVSNSVITIQPSANFHHLPGRKLPPSFSN